MLLIIIVGVKLGIIYQMGNVKNVTAHAKNVTVFMNAQNV